MTNEPSWLLLAVALTVVLALAGTAVWLSMTEARAAARRFSPGRDERHTNPALRRRPPRSAFGGSEETRLQRAAVIVNPTKFTDLAKARAEVEQVCRSQGWAEPLWLETTADDPGLGQTRRALDEGVDLICALGGDGTVRTVGSALVGTGTAMGLLSAGTGNLLARNLKLPVDDLERALTVALTGRNERIDTCTLTLTRPEEAELLERYADDDGPDENVDLQDATDHPEPGSRPRTEEHVFLAMAGLGFDAEVMAGAPEKLKAKVGWAAYIVSGARHLRGPQFVVDLSTDDGTRFRRRVRSVVVGNVGRLQGGVVLMPEARADDGVIHAVLLSPQGVVGWGAVAMRLATRQRKGHQRVDHYTSHEITVSSDKPVEIQLDGDTMGMATEMKVVVNPSSLVVRRRA
ncbi:MAG: diacylglycerol kinase family lipid kinase [Actinomycetota bacterium]|nr:diacylglycerol kinase family lipid kinase [Actinomycetota bacterium]